MDTTMNMKHAVRCTTAISLALVFSAAYAAGDAATSSTETSSTNTQTSHAALNDQGYNVGTVDGRWGPNSQSAVRRFQAKIGLAESGTLDSSTLSALGVKG
jgi:peptidoglycan hydrolase-like protein with peptidoglycan-binding domain